MIGKTIKVNGIDFLVLDEIDNDNLFVIALNLDRQCPFNNKNNNYKNSLLQKEMKKWLKKSGIKALPREIDLLTMDGYKGYGKPIVEVAPLTIDEYRKYADIIIPNINSSMWLVTGWGRPNFYATRLVCFINLEGNVDYTCYDCSCGLAPTLIINKNQLVK